LDQTRSRAHIDARLMPSSLGNEPPLSVDGGTSGFVDRRRVSVQWFAGTILTALCGAALMAAPFHVARWRNQFRLAARTPSRSRCVARSVSAATSSAPQERPLADGGRADLRAPGDRVSTITAPATTKSCACGLCASCRQSVAERLRLSPIFAVHPQRMLADAGPGIPGRGRASRRARRRGRLHHARLAR